MLLFIIILMIIMYLKKNTFNAQVHIVYNRHITTLCIWSLIRCTNMKGHQQVCLIWMTEAKVFFFFLAFNTFMRQRQWRGKTGHEEETDRTSGGCSHVACTAYIQRRSTYTCSPQSFNSGWIFNHVIKCESNRQHATPHFKQIIYLIFVCANLGSVFYLQSILTWRALCVDSLSQGRVFFYWACFRRILCKNSW